VVIDVFSQHAPEVVLAENDHMVEAFPADGADTPLHVRILGVLG
jgi:hypothetical protein